MDRRRNKRYDLKAAASFFWKAPGAARSGGEGFVRDISERGVFVLTDHSPPLGASVRFEVLPTPTSAPVLVMRAKGEVIRVEPSSGYEQANGFAAATRTLTVRNRPAEGLLEVTKKKRRVRNQPRETVGRIIGSGKDESQLASTPGQ